MRRRCTRVPLTGPPQVVFSSRNDVGQCSTLPSRLHDEEADRAFLPVTEAVVHERKLPRDVAH